ncbi:MAG: hypothetical protein V3T17_04600, partial [Pseudomonadales bacterium]
DLKLVDANNEKTQEKDFVIKETSYRKLGLAKRYALTSQIHSGEAQHFSILFGQLTTRLLEWHTERGKQCGTIELEVSIDPMIKDLVTEKIYSFFSDTENFDFLSSIKVHAEVTDFNNNALASLDF